MLASLASLAEKPRSPIVILRREHKDLLDQLASNAQTKIKCCAAQLISYFQHWHNWKATRYPSIWIYQPLRDIREDLMKAYTLHVIRAALDLLEELGLLSIRRNARLRTHQYLLNSDRIEEELEKLYSPKKAKTGKKVSADKSRTLDLSSETMDLKCETLRFISETNTQIPSIDSCTDSCTLSEEREEVDFVQEEEIEDPWAVDEDEVGQEVSISSKDLPEILEKQEVFGEGHFSAPAESKLTKMVKASANPSPEPKCSEVVQDDLKPLPRLKSSDRPSGFRSQEEQDGFREALVELGKAKGVLSPAAWSSTIIKSINAGESCQYLVEYREGQQVGSCEKQEWEVAPGQPYEGFVSYLAKNLKKNEMTDSQAIVAAHQQLKNVNLARSLWESCKRAIVNLGEDRERQKQLGVQNAYLPPSLLPQRKVSLEQAAGALATLQSGCVQLQALEPATAEKKPAELTSAAAELEPAEEQPAELEPATTRQKIQEQLNSPHKARVIFARIQAEKLGYRVEADLVLPAGEEIPSLEYLASLLTNPITASRVERLLDAHPEWGFWIDAAGEIQDF
jgi:hypothetical protein